MPVIKIPTPFRYYTGGLDEIPASGSTVGEAMTSLVAQFPALKPHLYRSTGDLRAFVNLFVNGSNVRDLQGLDTPLAEADELRLVPSIAGGQVCPRVRRT